MYGVVESVDHGERTAYVQWFKVYPENPSLYEFIILIFLKTNIDISNTTIFVGQILLKRHILVYMTYAIILISILNLVVSLYILILIQTQILIP